MKKKDIVDAVHMRLGFPERESARLVETTFDIIKAALKEGEHVKISSFGKFYVREKKARMGRIPRTGKAVAIPAGKVISFKLSRVLRDAINEAHGTRTAE